MNNKKRCGLAVLGATGRMGGRVLRLAAESTDIVVVGGIDREERLGDRIEGGLVIEHAEVVIPKADVVIDFTAPAAVSSVAALCAAHGTGYVLASTGMSASDNLTIRSLAERCAVVQAANLSTGVNVMLELVELAAARLGVPFDVEISEIHHRHKRDAPSGTGLALGRAVKAGRPDVHDVLDRCQHTEARQSSELGYAPMRGGDASGDHTVFFLGDGERLEITHRSSSGDIFAAGALRAARWLLGRTPGLYSMRDVLAGND